MEKEIQEELQELKNLETAGTLDDAQTARLKILNSLSEAEKTAQQKSKDLESALAQKEHFRTKSEKEEADKKKALEELENFKKGNSPAGNKSLEVSDFIDISASLEGLDQREKEYLAKQYKLTGQPLSEIRKSEDFGFWQSAYQAKVEKDKTLNPSTRPSETTKEKSFTEKLEENDPIDIRESIRLLDEKEKLLAEKGMWVNPRQNRHTKVDLGK